MEAPKPKMKSVAEGHHCVCPKTYLQIDSQFSWLMKANKGRVSHHCLKPQMCPLIKSNLQITLMNAIFCWFSRN